MAFESLSSMFSIKTMSGFCTFKNITVEPEIWLRLSSETECDGSDKAGLDNVSKNNKNNYKRYNRE